MRVDREVQAFLGLHMDVFLLLGLIDMKSGQALFISQQCSSNITIRIHHVELVNGFEVHFHLERVDADEVKHNNFGQPQ